MGLIEKGKLIDAGELSEKVFYSKDTPTMKLYVDLLLLNAPAIDAVPVVHGRWSFTECEYFECSVCGGAYYNGCFASSEAREKLKNGDVYKYCPHCGARMDGDAQ